MLNIDHLLTDRNQTEEVDMYRKINEQLTQRSNEDETAQLLQRNSTQEPQLAQIMQYCTTHKRPMMFFPAPNASLESYIVDPSGYVVLGHLQQDKFLDSECHAPIASGFICIPLSLCNYRVQGDQLACLILRPSAQHWAPIRGNAEHAKAVAVLITECVQMLVASVATACSLHTNIHTLLAAHHHDDRYAWLGLFTKIKLINTAEQEARRQLDLSDLVESGSKEHSNKVVKVAAAFAANVREEP